MYANAVPSGNPPTLINCTIGSQCPPPLPQVVISPEGVTIGGRDATPPGYTGRFTRVWTEGRRAHVKVEDGTVYRASLASIEADAPIWERESWVPVGDLPTSDT